MAPTKNTEKTDSLKGEDTKPAAPTVLEGRAPDQRDAEIALLKEQLADSQSQVAKLSERAQLAEMELEDRGGSAPKVSAPVDSEELSREERMFARMGAVIGAEVAKALGVQPRLSGKQPKPPLPEEFKGTRSYIVGAGKAFQNGRLFAKGEIITVKDQRPARDWTPVEEGDLKKALGPTRTHVAPTRANDRSVG